MANFGARETTLAEVLIAFPVGLPSEIVEKAQKEIYEEMVKTRTEKGYKTTVYNIIAYAQKT